MEVPVADPDLALAEIDAEIESIVAPLIQMRERLIVERVALKEQISVLDAKLVRLNRVVSVADPSLNKPGSKPGKPGQQKQKSEAAGTWTPSQALLDAAMQAFTTTDRPLSIPELADLTGRSGASMDKVVRHLRSTEIVRAAGKAPNPDRPQVKRNVYALMTSTNGTNGNGNGDGTE